jgi:hypothetical protein
VRLHGDAAVCHAGPATLAAGILICLLICCTRGVLFNYDHLGAFGLITMQ